jgi:hypothetical protein
MLFVKNTDCGIKNIASLKTSLKCRNIYIIGYSLSKLLLLLLLFRLQFLVMEKALFVIAVGLILFITACKKEIIQNSPTTDSTATSASQTDLIKDSVYLYSKKFIFGMTLFLLTKLSIPVNIAGRTRLNQQQQSWMLFESCNLLTILVL